MEHQQPPQSANPRPRWLRFSLRTLLVVMTLLCIWLALQVNAARRQREAVAAILKAGGAVWWDYQLMPVPGTPGAFTYDGRLPPRAPAWIRELLGDDYFRAAAVVTIGGRPPPITESDLECLTELPHLLIVGLQDPKMVVNGSINQRSLRDSDLAFLGRLSELLDLEVDSREIHGSGLASLVKLQHLRRLGLWNTTIDDEGMKQIGKLTTLEVLLLPAGYVTDADAANLRNLSNLEALYLHGSEITDAGLTHLKVLPNLKSLDLLQTKVTAAGIADLQKSLPNTKILGP